MEISLRAGMDMSKRILVVIHRLRTGGGAQRVASEVGSRLSKRGHDVSFFTFYSSESGYDIEGDSFTLKGQRKFYPLEYSLDIVRSAKEISKICEREDIETVVSFLHRCNVSVLLSKILFGNDARIIVSVRNNPRAMDKITNIQKKYLHPKADEIVVQTERIKQIIKQDFSIENVVIIPNPVQLKKIKELAEEEIPSKHKEIFGNDFVFINVGGLREQKGQWHLLRSFKKVTQELENSHLVILGEGELREELKDLRDKLDLDREVSFLGNVDNVFPYLRESDCFVLSSLHEGYPNVILEALSQNLPVISTDCVSGPREILSPELSLEEEIDYPYFGEYGIITPQLDEEILFEMIEEEPLSKQEEILSEAMVKVARSEAVEERYRNGIERLRGLVPERIVDKWEELL